MLCQPPVAAWIKSALQFRHRRGDCRIRLLVLMPDHLHALMSFAPAPGLKATITAWKHYAYREQKIAWQRDFFEHRIRNDENLAEKAHYIRMNPVRAGLVDRHAAWPYVWDERDFDS